MNLQEVAARTAELEKALVAEIRHFEEDTGLLVVNRVNVVRDKQTSRPNRVELDITLKV